MLTTQQKYDLYANETWIYNKKHVKLKNLKHHELEKVKAYLKKYPQGNQYGKLKSYWIEAIDGVIRFRNVNATKQAIGLIHDRRIQKANNTANAIAESIVTMMSKQK
jgi:hypothetical protein